jgi:hypothetical protein
MSPFDFVSLLRVSAIRASSIALVLASVQGFDGWFISNDRALPYPDDVALSGL